MTSSVSQGIPKLKTAAVTGLIAGLLCSAALPLAAGPAFAQAQASTTTTSTTTTTTQAAGGAATSQGARLGQIRDMVRRSVAEQGVPGYAIAIIQNGSVVFTETCGFADLGRNIPVDQDTSFGLASVTKTFTGLAILHLVDEGKISPDATLDRYLKNIPPAWQKLTIFQLASMRAGLPESRDGELPWPEEMRYLEGQPLVYQPNTQHIYSNPSFRLLGSVIEAVTGQTYMDYVANLVFKPLGMSETGTTSSLAPGGRVSCQYVGQPGGPVRKIEPKNPMTSYSAGMLASSIRDMSFYAQALLNKQILSPQAYQTYFYERPPLAGGEAVNWAYGWGSSVNARIKQRVLGMNGGLPGVSSTILLLPDSNCAVVALANLRRKTVPAIARRAMVMFASPDGQAAGSEGDEAEGAGQ